MLSRMAPALLVALFGLYATPGARAQSNDPRAAAFQALRSASTVPVSGSAESGAVRQLGFDVQALGATPAQQANEFLAAYGAVLGQTGPDQRLVLRSVFNEGPLNVASFRQTYKGVPVFGGEVRVWIESSPSTGLTRITGAGGALLPDPALEGGLDTEASVAPDVCVAAAQAYLGRPGSTPLAEPRLMIYDGRLFARLGGAHLVWAAAFADGDPRQVLCDAHTGAVVFDRALVYDALDLWLGLQFPNPSHTYLGDENGLNGQGQAHAEAVAEWWHAHNIYNFFTNSFGWRGTTGNDNQLQLLVDSNTTQFYHDPFGEAVQIQQGWACFDITAHEFAHGIIHHSSDLVYKGVPGALNEGYADAMGVFLDSADWLLFEERTSAPGIAVRNYADPPNPSCCWPSQPDQLSELCTSNMQCTYTADNDGVHINSGILNKAHYLIATGAAFNGRPAFAGLGRTKMGVLAFVVMRTLPSSATFQDARSYSIFIAGLLAKFSLYGFVASDACAVKNGFSSVEIGPADVNCDGVDDNFQDPDGDFIPSSIDNCPNVWNPSQANWDNDGVGDACDTDFDNDGRPDANDNCPTVPNWNQQNLDGDALGDACDPDDDNDGLSDVNDNCPVNYNPSQFDGDNNGFGDACDPDVDGDGFYVSADNCTFVYNPAQADSDGDMLGDACDLCPNVHDWNGAYLVQKWNPPPKPDQPDSDEDGVPDACDPDAFGAAALDLNGSPYNPGQMFQPDGFPMPGRVAGPGGGRFRIPVPVCDPDGDPDPNAITETVFLDLDPAVDVSLLDDDGLVLEHLRPGPPDVNARGLRVAPDCARRYFLEFTLGLGFSGPDDFMVYSSLVQGSSDNPWVTPGSGDPPPPPIADLDGDGLPDSIDSCPAAPDPTGADGDGDGLGDVCDNCPGAANASQEDADRDGAGAACDCDDADPRRRPGLPEVCDGIDNDCDLMVDNPTRPGPMDVTLNPQPLPPGGGPALEWAPEATSQTYDVVFLDAGLLAGGGDFTAATMGCLAEDLTTTSYGPLPVPPINEAFLFLVRGNNCAGPGTYDSGSPQQAGPRDAGINASPQSCQVGGGPLP